MIKQLDYLVIEKQRQIQAEHIALHSRICKKYESVTLRFCIENVGAKKLGSIVHITGTNRNRKVEEK